MSSEIGCSPFFIFATVNLYVFSHCNQQSHIQGLRGSVNSSAIYCTSSVGSSFTGDSRLLLAIGSRYLKIAPTVSLQKQSSIVKTPYMICVNLNVNHYKRFGSVRVRCRCASGGMLRNLGAKRFIRMNSEFTCTSLFTSTFHIDYNQASNN